MRFVPLRSGPRFLSIVVVCLGLALTAGPLAAAPPSEARIHQLIEQLGHPDYNVRERAQEELAEIGFAAFEALSAATRHDDLEVAARARYLLRLIRIEWSQADDPEAVKKALEDYETQTPDERLRRIKELVRLSGNNGLPAVCRLIRYEQSELLSKLAAMEILDRAPADPRAWAPWAEILQENLGRSTRPGAQWLRTYLRVREAPKEAIAAWSELVEAEQAVWQRSPQHSTLQIVISLLYHHASLQLDQGDKEAAAKTAQRARELAPGKEPAALLAHLETARSLQQRGMFKWAEEEYRHVIESGPGEFAAIGLIYLSEMHHDEGKDDQAAATLDEVFQLIEKKAINNVDIFGRSVGELRARKNYFLACHWERQGDRAKQREYLEEALRHDTGEIDVLIACHRLPDASPEFRARIDELVAKAADRLRQAISKDPESPDNYNQFAWLVGNTGGDLDEALRCAQKAVEMDNDRGAYYDTLAHVFAGRGDYENAVKYQRRAVELDPHSGLIVRALERFEDKWKEQQAAKGESKP